MHEQAVESFLTWLVEEQNCTENTIAAYRNDLRSTASEAVGQFLGFLASSATVEAWAAVTEADIQAYREALKAREYAPATLARKMGVPSAIGTKRQIYISQCFAALICHYSTDMI